MKIAIVTALASISLIFLAIVAAMLSLVLPEDIMYRIASTLLPIGLTGMLAGGVVAVVIGNIISIRNTNQTRMSKIAEKNNGNATEKETASIKWSNCTLASIACLLLLALITIANHNLASVTGPVSIAIISIMVFCAIKAEQTHKDAVKSSNTELDQS